MSPNNIVVADPGKVVADLIVKEIHQNAGGCMVDLQHQ